MFSDNYNSCYDMKTPGIFEEMPVIIIMTMISDFYAHNLKKY